MITVEVLFLCKQCKSRTQQRRNRAPTRSIRQIVLSAAALSRASVLRKREVAADDLSAPCVFSQILAAEEIIRSSRKDVQRLFAKVLHVELNSHSEASIPQQRMGEEVTVSVDAVNERAQGATQKPASQPPPSFASLSQKALRARSKQVRKIPVPPNRMSPLKSRWMEIYEPIVKYLKLQIRMNLRTKCVELKTGKATEDTGALQKGADFVKAFVLGFAVADAIALIRLDDLYIETFEVRDIRATLKGDHLSRAVGRIAGKDGRTKFTIENATKTRIVVADTKIHILGSYENTRLARHSISSLVLGAAPGKVYNKLRNVSARLNERNF